MRCLVRDEAAEKRYRKEAEKIMWGDIVKWGISTLHSSWAYQVIYIEVEIPDFDY